MATIDELIALGAYDEVFDQQPYLSTDVGPALRVPVPAFESDRETDAAFMDRAERAQSEMRTRFPDWATSPDYWRGRGEFPRSSEPPPVPLPLGTERRFRRTPPPVQDPLEDIRKQINAVQFKTAQEALDAATQFQALRAYQRDLEAGKDPTRWLPLLFKKNPTAAAAFANATAKVPAPAVTNLGGYDVLRYGRRGEQARVIPKATPAGPVQAFPVLDEDGKPMEDFVAVPSGTGRGMTVRLRRREGQSQSANEMSLLRRINDAEDEFAKIPTLLSAFEDVSIEKEKDRKAAAKKPFEDAQKRRESLRKQIDGWRAELRSPQSPRPASSGALPSPKSKSEYDELPAGSRYLDPNGVERVKK